MEIGFHRFTFHEEDGQNSPQNSDESPPSHMFHDTKATSTSSPKRSRRGTKKRVVYVPIKEVDGSRFKAETNAPPSDSWAWRKYGQKPIKGSPYPRGYYKCSSSKGCPARKQVERSQTDPTMMMVTYSCEHNHPSPASRNTTHHHRNPPPTTTDNHPEQEQQQEQEPPPIDDQPHQKFEVGPFAPAGDEYYRWFSDLDATSATMLESPMMASDDVAGESTDMFSIREDVEESFFDDLGELPECTAVFRQREMEHRHRSLAPWCGTTG
ncbi:hypothetical protein SSX86_015674 [Deinandra increscens subsp. villosa]|uniref:WRKY domain-containing protein n=1 Tax=Deinandra increscens subsp. villosa TaxID=3103831 RepID=A0AAP0CWP5_9ASTR